MGNVCTLDDNEVLRVSKVFHAKAGEVVKLLTACREHTLLTDEEEHSLHGLIVAIKMLGIPYEGELEARPDETM